MDRSISNNKDAFGRVVGSGAKEPFLAVCGLNHRSAAVDLRERLAFSDELKPRVLEHVLENTPADEAVVVSTCNRVEVVVSGNDLNGKPDLFLEQLENSLATVSGVKPEDFSPYLYHYSEKNAVGHVFRVAAGLDSMVIGEPQVLGQLKDAYRLAREQGAAKMILSKLFDRAFSVAKQVRTNTAIGQNAVSVCYAAKELSRQIFGDLGEASVMLIGAGDMASLALKNFKSAGVSRFFVVNRTLSRACELADLSKGVPLSFENFQSFLPQADIVLGLSALQPNDSSIIDRSMVEIACSARFGRPQFYVDLGVPRNFSAGIDGIEDVFLYNIDDLQEVVKSNLEQRSLAAEEAELIVNEEVLQYWSWLERRPIEKLIGEFARECTDFQAREIDKTLRRLKALDLSAEQKSEIEAALNDLAPALLAKFFHQPFSALRANAKDDATLLEAFKQFFLKARE